MKFSESWLREYCNPPVDTQTLCDQLTMLGLEIEGVEAAAPAFSGVQVGEVLSVAPHPNADKLRCCTVRSSEGELAIVCGAANVAAGQKVALAMIGGRLPDGTVLRQAKLRGEPSHGMLCSPRELGLDELAGDEPGIWVLPEDAPVGTDLRSYLGLDDAIIEVAITPNRGDCFSIRGLARELAAANAMAATGPEQSRVKASGKAGTQVNIEDAVACTAYLGRELRNFDASASTPLWLRERLRRSGIRALHPAVDVCNYVMLELGQPMHAFDLDKLEGGINVRWAREGETLQALNGEVLQLGGKDLLISDAREPLAVAGVIGGEASAVQAGTVSVFLESACFSPKALAGTARRHRLHTEASLRFERGVDPALQRHALERATELLQAIAGGAAGPIVSGSGAAHKPVQIKLRLARINGLLGTRLAAAEVEACLPRLGLKLQRQTAAEQPSWQVSVPSHRYDLNIEADLIEEVARLIGYDALPAVTPNASLPPTRLPEERLNPRRLAGQLVAQGFHEAVTYSFIDTELSQTFAKRGGQIVLDNPIAEQLSCMRSSMLPGLLQALRHNLQRQIERVNLFEIGPLFSLADDQQINERACIAGVMQGSAAPLQWSLAAREQDFFDLRNVVEQLLALTGEAGSFQIEMGGPEWLHPGQRAVVKRNGHRLGCLGRLHPALLAVLDLKTAPLLFELELEDLCQARVPRQTPVPAYPGTRRDLALVLPVATSYAKIQQLIHELEIEILSSVQVFDIYAGKGLPSNSKSVALALNFQGETRTLTDVEVGEAVESVCRQLQQKAGAKLRD